MAEGLNTEGYRLVVKKISQNARRNHVMTSGPELAQAADKGGLKIVAAAGPYTFDDDLSFTVCTVGPDLRIAGSVLLGEVIS